WVVVGHASAWLPALTLDPPLLAAFCVSGCASCASSGTQNGRGVVANTGTGSSLGPREPRRHRSPRHGPLPAHGAPRDVQGAPRRGPGALDRRTRRPRLLV